MHLWETISNRFDEWTPPLRPGPDDITAFAHTINKQDNVLLLGLTEELLPLSAKAIDLNEPLVKKNPEKALVGNWNALPFENTFDVILGDGCFTVFQDPLDLLFEQAMKALKKGGRFVQRVFIAPEIQENLDVVLSQRHRHTFHAFKWRVAHAMATPYVPVKAFYDVLFPLTQNKTLEVYKDDDSSYFFPKLSELPKWDRIHFNTSYDLAERCPIITWIKK